MHLQYKRAQQDQILRLQPEPTYVFPHIQSTLFNVSHTLIGCQLRVEMCGSNG